MSAVFGRRDDGFTLVEMMVSVALLGMLSLVMLGGLHFGRRVWEASETKTEITDRIRAFQTTLSQSLSRIYPEVDASTEDQAALVEFDGERDHMTFLAPASDGTGVLIRETFGPEIRDGVARLVTLQQLELARGGKPNVVDAHLPPIYGLRITYYGSTKPNENPGWHDSWAGQSKLPERIGINVNFADRRYSWPALVVSPRIEADVSCTFDPLTRSCTGR